MFNINNINNIINILKNFISMFRFDHYERKVLESIKISWNGKKVVIN